MLRRGRKLDDRAPEAWSLLRAAEYPAVAQGDRHFALFWRTLAWDHAPGALLLREAGGSVMRWDGSAYLPAIPGEGLLIARNPAVADEVSRRVDLATAAA